jgi:epsilon-lactone hydrolase
MAFRVFLTFLWSVASVTLRRRRRGPLWPGWTWTFECFNHYLKQQTRQASRLPTMLAQRRYADALAYRSPALKRVKVQAAAGSPAAANWHSPDNAVPDRVVLYLHGGGWAFFSKEHYNLIAHVALATRARTLVVDYRLSPEHPYPAALEDCLAAYRYLLAGGLHPDQIAVGGDSAGGNLTLALLQTLRAGAGPLPSSAFLISPCVDVGNSGASLEANSRFDWVDAEEVRTWTAWYAAGADPKDPLLSPLYADLGGLPPFYLQAASAEVLIDQIRAFVEAARRQGADPQFDVWEGMTHDFQAYGDLLPQAQEALRCLGQVVDARLAAISTPAIAGPA